MRPLSVVCYSSLAGTETSQDRIFWAKIGLTGWRGGGGGNKGQYTYFSSAQAVVTFLFIFFFSFLFRISHLFAQAVVPLIFFSFWYFFFGKKAYMLLSVTLSHTHTYTHSLSLLFNRCNFLVGQLALKARRPSHTRTVLLAASFSGGTVWNQIQLRCQFRYHRPAACRFLGRGQYWEFKITERHSFCYMA